MIETANQQRGLALIDQAMFALKEFSQIGQHVSEILSGLLTQALRVAGVFEQVMAKQVNIRTRYQLSGTLLMFEYDELQSRAFIDIDV